MTERLPWRRPRTGFIAYPDGDEHADRFAHIHEHQVAQEGDGRWRWSVIYGKASHHGGARTKQLAADRATALWPAMKAELDAVGSADREKREVQAWLDGIEQGGPFDDLNVAGAELDQLQRVMRQATDCWTTARSRQRPSGNLEELLRCYRWQRI